MTTYIGLGSLGLGLAFYLIRDFRTWARAIRRAHRLRGSDWRTGVPKHFQVPAGRKRLGIDK